MTVPIRTMLSVPGIRPRFIEKAHAVPADAIVLDLEDSVGFAEKPAARQLVAEAGPAFPKRRRLLLVRPNDLSTGLLEDDLDAVVWPWLDAIHLPKVHGPDVLRQADHYLTFLERRRAIEVGSVRIVAWVESAAGVADVEAIAASSPRLIALSFGAEDYVTSLGVMRTKPGVEIEFGRARTANAAMAHGLIPVDGPEPDYRDLDHFERDLLHAKELGYRGKFCIHPDQVDVANRVLAPPADQLDWARRVVDAYEQGERDGLGAVGVDGAMVDRPIYLRARALIEEEERFLARTPG